MYFFTLHTVYKWRSHLRSMCEQLVLSRQSGEPIRPEQDWGNSPERSAHYSAASGKNTIQSVPLWNEEIYNLGTLYMVNEIYLCAIGKSADDSRNTLRHNVQKKNYVIKCVCEDREPWDSSANTSFIWWRYYQLVTNTKSNNNLVEHIRVIFGN